VQNGNKFAAENDTEQALKEKAVMQASVQKFHLAHPSLQTEYPLNFAIAYITEDNKFWIVRGNIGNYSIRYEENEGNVHEDFFFGGGMDISAFSYDRDTSNIVLPNSSMSVELVFPVRDGEDIRNTPSRLVQANILADVNQSKVFNLKDFMEKTKIKKTGAYHEMWVGQ
jgi:hypothetical protein